MTPSGSSTSGDRALGLESRRQQPRRDAGADPGVAAVVDAVGDQIEVLLDGGVRRGSDVVKALALGARAVMIGRAYLWGLAPKVRPAWRTYSTCCAAASTRRCSPSAGPTSVNSNAATSSRPMTSFEGWVSESRRHRHWRGTRHRRGDRRCSCERRLPSDRGRSLSRHSRGPVRAGDVGRPRRRRGPPR